MSVVSPKLGQSTSGNQAALCAVPQPKSRFSEQGTFFRPARAAKSNDVRSFKFAGCVTRKDYPPSSPPWTVPSNFLGMIECEACQLWQGSSTLAPPLSQSPLTLSHIPPHNHTHKLTFLKFYPPTTTQPGGTPPRTTMVIKPETPIGNLHHLSWFNSWKTISPLVIDAQGQGIGAWWTIKIAADGVRG